MREGTIKVRQTLGGDVPAITDKEIQEALWHYYYDVEKSVTYLLNSRTTKRAKQENKKVVASGKKGNGGSYFIKCSFPPHKVMEPGYQRTRAVQGASSALTVVNIIGRKLISGQVHGVWLSLITARWLLVLHRLQLPTISRICLGSTFQNSIAPSSSSPYTHVVAFLEDRVAGLLKFPN